MIKPETMTMVDNIITKLNEQDGMFVQGMVTNRKVLNKDY
jgi:hypothetical protein